MAASNACSDDIQEMECPICLDSCIYPAKLPCGHIFCFLCIKGLQNFRCALCRTEFPNAVLDQPDLVMPMDASTSTVDQNEHRWFYEGRNGWWQFDERTSQDIEDAYKNGDRHCTIFVAGYLYVVDFDQMLQLRLNDQLRKRKVKRDLVSTPKLGIAGLLTPDAST